MKVNKALKIKMIKYQSNLRVKNKKI